MIIFMILWAFKAPIPVIYVTHPDAVCVYVEPASAGSCDDLPDTYSTQMVSPLWRAPK